MLIQRATLLDGTVDRYPGRRADRRGGRRSGRPARGAVLDAGGGTVLPGLHDHHVHLRSAASALDSLRVGPPAVSTEAQLARCLVECRRRAPTDGSAPSATTSRSPASWTGPRSMPCCPTFRCASSTAAACCGSSTPQALGRVGLAEHPDGRLRSADRGWSDALQRREADLAELSRRITATRRHRRHRRHPRPRRR